MYLFKYTLWLIVFCVCVWLIVFLIKKLYMYICLQHEFSTIKNKEIP